MAQENKKDYEQMRSELLAAFGPADWDLPLASDPINLARRTVSAAWIR